MEFVFEPTARVEPELATGPPHRPLQVGVKGSAIDTPKPGENAIPLHVGGFRVEQLTCELRADFRHLKTRLHGEAAEHDTVAESNEVTVHVGPHSPASQPVVDDLP